MNETSISREALIASLNKISETIKNQYGVSLCFVEIFQRRWSYIAGVQEENSSFFPPARIKVNERFGIIADRWNDLPEKVRDQLTALLRDTMIAYEKR